MPMRLVDCGIQIAILPDLVLADSLQISSGFFARACLAINSESSSKVLGENLCAPSCSTG